MEGRNIAFLLAGVDCNAAGFVAASAQGSVIQADDGLHVVGGVHGLLQRAGVCSTGHLALRRNLAVILDIGPVLDVRGCPLLSICIKSTNRPDIRLFRRKRHGFSGGRAPVVEHHLRIFGVVNKAF